VKPLDAQKVIDTLVRIMEFELAGVVRYTHYSLMVSGPNRIPIVQFFKTQATESLLHAQQAGEILTGLGGHPALGVARLEESFRHSVEDVLRESLKHEQEALTLYGRLLDLVKDRSVYLEEFARTQIGQEELHGLELRKMLRDIGVEAPMAGAKDGKEKKRKKKDRH
jgi:bacterioferritin